MSKGLRQSVQAVPVRNQISIEQTETTMQSNLTRQSMFETTPLNPPDAIFGLIEEFKKDPRKDKVNLSVGVYQDEAGTTPIMKCVGNAEKVLLEQAGSKSYLPIDGIPGYNGLIGNLILGDELCPVSTQPVRSTSIHSATAQTPGGTAALRVAGDLMKQNLGSKTIWMSNLTWANHTQIYSAVELEIKNYDYLDDRGTGLDFGKMMSSLDSAQPGDALLLHTVCHNPTGVDLGREQWQQLTELILDKALFPIFDFAYQGFGDDIESDAFPIRNFCTQGGEAFICNSFSKNFGLYAERVGGITAVTSSADSAKAILSQIKRVIRASYSNPPLHGAAIVNKVLGDQTMRSDWVTELASMRDRIKQLRSEFVRLVNSIIPDGDYEYVNHQRGMFSYSGLSRDQAERLKSEYGIYALRSGRINIAGLNSSNIKRVCTAIAEVMK